MKKVIHATNLIGIENLYNHESNGNEYICCSSMDCNGYMNRDVLFQLSGTILESFYGDCGSDGHENIIGCKDTPYDEIHVQNDYEIEGLYYVEEKDIETYGMAYAYITCILELPCIIINASEEEKEQISNWQDHFDTEEEFLQILTDAGIENLIV